MRTFKISADGVEYTVRERNLVQAQVLLWRVKGCPPPKQTLIREV
jgi:hypothetical protein